MQGGEFSETVANGDGRLHAQAIEHTESGESGAQDCGLGDGGGVRICVVGDLYTFVEVGEIVEAVLPCAA